MGVLFFRVVRASAPLALVAAVGACARHTQPSSNGGEGRDSVTGSVAYRERVALPPDAIAEVSIVDASIMDVAAQVIAKTIVPSEGRQVPLPFTLRYDARKIKKTHLYTIRAVIRSAGEMLFTTDIVHGVITQENPTHMDLMLVRVDPDVSVAPSDLVGTSWLLEDLNGTGVIDGARATLDFPGRGKVVGSGSCNRFFGTVEISGTSIRFGAIGSTRMACAEGVSMQEIKYFEALEGAHRFTIDGRVLSIYGARTDKPLRFTRATP